MPLQGCINVFSEMDVIEHCVPPAQIFWGQGPRRLRVKTLPLQILDHFPWGKILIAAPWGRRMGRLYFRYREQCSRGERIAIGWR